MSSTLTIPQLPTLPSPRPPDADSLLTSRSTAEKAAAINAAQAAFKEMQKERVRGKAFMALQDLCRQPDVRVEEVRNLIQNKGAPPMRSQWAEGSPLHLWAREGKVELVKALLETPLDIDFRTVDEAGNTPFHCVFCGPAKSDELIGELVGALLHRLRTRVNDVGDAVDASGVTLWEVRSAAGMTILDLAVSTGHLSVVYPLLKDRPYYRDHAAPLPLEADPSEADWSRLSANEQQSLERPNVAELTQRLCELVRQDEFDVADVQHFVRGNADILYRPATFHNHTVHYCALKGSVVVLAALLETPRDVDFTLSGWYQQTPLHCLFDHLVDEAAHTAEQIKAMVCAILDRLATHPKDRVDWGQLNGGGCDFLSLAARDGVLSDVYPLVKDQPYYVNKVKPLVLRYRPLDGDWAGLSERDRCALEVPCESEDMNRRLFDEVTMSSPSLPAIASYVRKGSDILYTPEEAVYSALHYCALDGNVRLLTELLETTRSVDFSSLDKHGRSVLHCAMGKLMGGAAHTAEQIKAMMCAICDRLATHPKDRVDWGQLNGGGCDFLSLAARDGVLSDVYPLVKDQPYYVNKVKPLVLRYRPLDGDWARLSERDRCALEVPCESEDMDRRLFDEVTMSSPSLPAIASYVRKGSDILYTPEEAVYSTLHYCVLCGHVESLKVLLETPRDVDFTLSGWYQQTPLHCLFDHLVDEAAHTAEQIKAMVCTILDRLATYPKDRVDWGQLNGGGCDFLSLAARDGVLSDVYPLVKDQPYYVNKVKPLVLRYRPLDGDWAGLSERDRCALEVPCESEDMNRRLFDEVTMSSPSLPAIASYVRKGSDILYMPEEAVYSALHYCALDGNVRLLTELLETTRSVDFSSLDKHGRSVLHCAMGKFMDGERLFHTADQTKEMLNIILKRLQSHPDDKVEWS